MSAPESSKNVSDGHHTFEELYQHRNRLMLALMRIHRESAGWSRQHADGTMFEDSIIVGVDLPSGEIVYHFPESMIPLLLKAGIQELDRAPVWDGSTPEDTIRRLENFVTGENKL